MTSREDLDDVAFRALLEPLALEVLPGRSSPPAARPVDPASVVPETPPADQPPSAAANPAHPENLESAIPTDFSPPAVDVVDDPTTPLSAAAAADRPASLATRPSHPASSPPSSSPAPEPEHGPLPPAAVPADPAGFGLERPVGRGLTAPPSVPLHPVSFAPGGMPDNGSPPRPAESANPAPAASDLLPEHWSPPSLVPVHPVAAASEMLPEDWSAPPEAGPDRLTSEPQPHDHAPLPADQFAPMTPGILPREGWHLTVALSDQPGPPPAGAPMLATASSVRPILAGPPAGADRSPVGARAEGTVRQHAGPRLIARAGPAREVVVQPGGSTQLVMRRPVLPPARVRWSVVLLSGLASAFIVACMSWLFELPAPIDPPIEAGTAVRSDTGSAVTAVPPSTPGSQSMPSAAVPSAPSSQSVASSPGSPTTSISGPPSDPAQAAPPAPAQYVTPAQTPAAGSEPAPASAAAPARLQPAVPSQAMIGLLTQRGDAAVAMGDIIAARLLYERAAAMGSATAATSAGKTYDLDFLLRADTHGIRPDPAAAEAWYRKAAALGDPEARTLLDRLEAQSRP